MNRAVWLYLGVLITVIASFVGLVQIPDRQLRGLQPVKDDLGVERPQRPEGGVLAGRAEYIGLGCLYCHSQQVRPEGFGADLARGWGVAAHRGPRLHLGRSARSWGRCAPAPTSPTSAPASQAGPGTCCTSTSPGSPPPAPRCRSTRSSSPGSASSCSGRPMPSRFPEGEPRPGWVVVPTQRARDLVTYLGSLDHSYAVPEVR